MPRQADACGSVVSDTLVTTHDTPALLIATCALTASTLKAVATALAIRCACILRTSTRIAGACLCGITSSSWSAADSAIVGKLTISAAPFVAVIADCVVLEFAGRWITTRVARTTAFTTTIAIFTLLHDAIATFLRADSLDVSVGGQTGRFDTIATQSAANVANTAWAESSNTGTGRWVHNIGFTCIAGGRT